MGASVIPGRNDPCPCGSGKKYKKCHGAAPAGAADDAAQLAEQARRAIANGDPGRALPLALALRRRHPHHPEAIRLCGLAHIALANWEEARRDLEQLLKRVADDAAVYSNLGLVLTRLGRADEGQRHCRKALQIDPQLAEAHNNLAQALAACGKHAEAAQAYRQAIAHQPRSAAFRFNLGALLQSANGDAPAEAERCYREALAVDPKFVPALVNLGMICLGRGALEEAGQYLRSAHALDPGNAQAVTNLGIERLQARDYPAAIERFREAMRLADYRPAYVNLGVALENSGDLPAAIAAYRSALEHDPADPVSFRNLLTLLIHSRDIPAAYALMKQYHPDLARLPPALAPAVAQVLQKTADLDRLDEVRPLLRMPSGRAPPSQDDLLALNYDDSLSEREIYEMHRAWGKRAAEAIGRLPPAAPSRRARLRLGYLSPDFRRHAVGLFFRNLVAHHDKSRFEVFCYANLRRGDELTEAIQRHADHFAFVHDLADRTLVEKIRGDGIDILVDLAGHTEASRLPALAARPAPVQMMYLGYPNSSGADFIDYWITDRHAHRHDDDLHVEKLLRLPESFLCFGSFDERPLSAAPPAARNGHVTFGSFNNLAKLSRATLALWSRLLHAVPASRLAIKTRGVSRDPIRANVVAQFGKFGIAEERLILLEHVADPAGHLDSYNEVDIALDAIPYNGTTTTCEALWMGVPVVTLVGDAHRQRTSYSILKNIGVEETIAHTADEFVAAASRLAGDLGRLADLRARTAAQIRRSILCDAGRFARQFEEALAGCSAGA